MRAAIGDLTPTVGGRAACEAFDFPRASFYPKGLGVVFPAAVAAVRVRTASARCRGAGSSPVLP